MSESLSWQAERLTCVCSDVPDEAAHWAETGLQTPARKGNESETERVKRGGYNGNHWAALPSPPARIRWVCVCVKCVCMHVRGVRACGYVLTYNQGC